MTARELVVLADADNTLWDTDALFAGAQLRLLSHVEAFTGTRCPSEDRLGFVRNYDQALAARHHLHLKYPPQMLVAALAAALASTSPDVAASSIIAGRHVPLLRPEDADTAVAAYLEALAKTPELLTGVSDGLQLANEVGLPIYVMTEGRADKQRRVIVAHNLVHAFSGVWELTKNKAQFERLRRRFDNASVVVIGDQPDRDIVPAHQAGCMAVLVPSRFRPKWHREDAWKTADLVAEDFLEAITWTVSKCRNRGSAIRATGH